MQLREDLGKCSLLTYYWFLHIVSMLVDMLEVCQTSREDDGLTALLCDSLAVGLVTRLTRAIVRGWWLAELRKKTKRGQPNSAGPSTITLFFLDWKLMKQLVRLCTLGTWAGRKHKEATFNTINLVIITWNTF